MRTQSADQLVGEADARLLVERAERLVHETAPAGRPRTRARPPPAVSCRPRVRAGRRRKISSARRLSSWRRGRRPRLRGRPRLSNANACSRRRASTETATALERPPHSASRRSPGVRRRLVTRPGRVSKARHDAQQGALPAAARPDDETNSPSATSILTSSRRASGGVRLGRCSTEIEPHEPLRKATRRASYQDRRVATGDVEGARTLDLRRDRAAL